MAGAGTEESRVALRIQLPFVTVARPTCETSPPYLLQASRTQMSLGVLSRMYTGHEEEKYDAHASPYSLVGYHFTPSGRGVWRSATVEQRIRPHVVEWRVPTSEPATTGRGVVGHSHRLHDTPLQARSGAS